MPVALPLKLSLTQKNKDTVNLKSASFVVIMLLYKGLTWVHSQKKPWLHFGQSFTLEDNPVLVSWLWDLLFVFIKISVASALSFTWNSKFAGSCTLYCRTCRTAWRGLTWKTMINVMNWRALSRRSTDWLWFDQPSLEIRWAMRCFNVECKIICHWCIKGVF